MGENNWTVTSIVRRTFNAIIQIGAENSDPPNSTDRCKSTCKGGGFSCRVLVTHTMTSCFNNIVALLISCQVSHRLV